MNFRNLFWGIILIVVGLFFFIQETTDLSLSRYFWPLLFITAGGLLLVRNQIREK